jgi:hypothetical protein
VQQARNVGEGEPATKTDRKWSGEPLLILKFRVHEISLNYKSID